MVGDKLVSEISRHGIYLGRSCTFALSNSFCQRGLIFKLMLEIRTYPMYYLLLGYR